MYAYRIPDLGPAEAKEKLADHPAARRLCLAGPWSFSAHPNGGTFAIWKDSSLKSIGDYGEPVATEDGLFYLPSKKPILPVDVARESVPNGSVDLDLFNGMRVTVAVATKAPMKRRFATKRAFGGYAGDLAREAFKLYDRLTEKDEKITYADENLRRVIFLAINSCYRLTEDALDQADWLTTVDDDPILEVVFGQHPKASPAAGATS